MFDMFAQFALNWLAKDQLDKNAKAQANAIVAEGNIQSANKARETKLRAASATVSFLQAGLEIAPGETPANAVQGIYATGLQDVNQIIANTNAKSKNIYTQARAKYIDTLAGQAKNFGFGGLETQFADLFPAGSVMNPIEWNQAPVFGSPSDPINWNG